MIDEPVQRSYDAVAPAYAARFYAELDEKPLDRALLEALAGEVRGRGRVADLGCGPGQVARYLADRGVEAFGVDLSPAMVEEARRLSPRVPFEIGSMLELPIADGSLAGVAAFYSIVNLTKSDVLRAFTEIARVLAPGAPVLLSFHLGDEIVHLDTMLDVAVTLDFFFHSRAFVEDALARAGLALEAFLERRAYACEHPSTRAYALARRPG